MKFSQKIVMASSVLLLVTITLLSIQQLSSVRHQVEALVDSSLNEMVKGVKSTVISEMESKKSLAQSVTEIIEIEPNNQQFVKDIIEKPEIKQSFFAIGLGYESNGFVVENDDNWEPDSSYDPRVRPWYKKAKQDNRLVVTDPYIDASSKTVIISIGTPVKSNGDLVAGMFYDLQLGGLADLVNGVNLLDSGYLFIVTADGTTIAHPQAEHNGENVSKYLPQAKVEEGKQRFELNGHSMLVKFTKVPTENWYIGALVDEDIAFAAVQKMRNRSILYTVIGLVLGVIAMSLLIKVLIKPLATLSGALEDVASGQGDLTKRLNTDTDHEFAQLAKGFNSFTETLQKQIQQSKAISEEILRGTEMTATGASQSAQAMSSQLEELEQLATAMNEMTVTATEVANNSQAAAAAAKEAGAATQDGSDVVNDTAHTIDTLSSRIEQAVEEVQGLESATANIETILKVINDIADQTNLLALNAAIEAARAGESGRGFAVVADEVRTLAQRTQESTTEIRTMIEQLQAGANSVSVAMNESKNTAVDAVDKAQAAEGALQRIRDAIERISDMNIQIASAAEEQSLVAEEINGNTVKIKDLSTKVADSATEANMAMDVQIENVREQDAILNKFIV